MSNFAAIPLVDFGPWNGTDGQRDALAVEVREICHEIGFMVLTNHGIEGEFIDDVFAMLERLFALPQEKKDLIDKRKSPHFRGWEGEGAEYTNGRPDIREQVDLWTEHPARPRGVEPAYLHLLGPNQWFPEEVLPGFQELLNQWFERLGALAGQLMECFSIGLGLDPNHLDEVFGTEQMSLTKLIRYPKTPDGAAGVNAHHDAGFLTILAPGVTPGLQVEAPDGSWIPVQHVPGAFVINIGEMLQGLTGNYFVATPHRVISAGERYAAGYFHGPSLTTTLEPLPIEQRFVDAVAASPRHANAGFMATADETAAGVGDMASDHKPATYGEQLWNYFCRSYPDNVAAHYS